MTTGNISRNCVAPVPSQFISELAVMIMRLRPNVAMYRSRIELTPTLNRKAAAFTASMVAPKKAYGRVNRAAMRLPPTSMAYLASR